LLSILTKLSALLYTNIFLNGQKIREPYVKNRKDSGLTEAV